MYRILAVVYVDRKNVNLELIKVELLKFTEEDH